MGIVLSPLAAVTEREQRRLADGNYPTLVDAVRSGPRWGPSRIGGVSEAMNLIEFFVHNEDVRRAAPLWTARRLGDGYDAALWPVPMLARTRLLRFTARVTVRAPGHGELTVGSKPATVTLTGAPGELTLFLFGRRTVAEVDLDGPADVVERLRVG
jgi:uncharacterized protein (TIGR03085 family)